MASKSESESKKQDVENEQKDEKVMDKNVTSAIRESVGILSIVVIWIIAGIVAFIYSLYCFSKSGSTADKILGLIIASIAGPFYFIYVAVYQAYCR